VTSLSQRRNSVIAAVIASALAIGGVGLSGLAEHHRATSRLTGDRLDADVTPLVQSSTASGIDSPDWGSGAAPPVLGRLRAAGLLVASQAQLRPLTSAGLEQLERDYLQLVAGVQAATQLAMPTANATARWQEVIDDYQTVLQRCLAVLQEKGQQAAAPVQSQVGSLAPSAQQVSQSTQQFAQAVEAYTSSTV
jgi:hypothetical protein